MKIFKKKYMCYKKPIYTFFIFTVTMLQMSCETKVKTFEELLITKSIEMQYETGALPDDINIEWIRQDSTFTVLDSLNAIKASIYNINHLDSSNIGLISYYEKNIAVSDNRIDSLQKVLTQYKNNRDSCYKEYSEMEEALEVVANDITGLAYDMIKIAYGSYFNFTNEMKTLKGRYVMLDDKIELNDIIVSNYKEAKTNLELYKPIIDQFSQSKKDSVLFLFYSSKHLVKYNSSKDYLQEYTVYHIKGKGENAVISKIYAKENE